MKTTNHEQQETDFPLKIGNPARRALEGAGYSRLQQLTKATEPELMKLHGMGPKALGLLRNALEAKGLYFSKTGWAGTARTKKAAQPVGKTEQVNEFMEKLDHPFKAEVEAVRGIIKGADKNITEKIKWEAPSFGYRGEYLVTFNLWEERRIHLVFHSAASSRNQKGRWPVMWHNSGLNKRERSPQPPLITPATGHGHISEYTSRISTWDIDDI